jgi:cyclic beta-1,2-glucan synthetase
MHPADLKRLVPEAPRALCAVLSPARGAVLPPIRSEIFGPERFAQHGRSLGLTHQAVRPRAREATFFPRLRSNIAVLRSAHAYLGAREAGGDDISPAAEWLLDNFHLIEAQLQAIHDGLPRRYFRSLPVLLDEPLAGLPRVYGVAWAFVAHADSDFDEDLLVRYLMAYQGSRELGLSEMWALPTTLRVVLVENLRRLAERLAAHKAAHALANLVCDRIHTLRVPVLERLRGLLALRGVDGVWLAQLALRLQDRVAGPGMPVPPALLDWLQQAQPDPAAALAQQSADQTADNLSVSNAVTSLRAIGDADWPDIVARSSVLMQRMLGAPLFAAEDIGTRDRTLHGVERLARRSGLGELAVADALLGLMMAPPAGQPLAATAGHWLDGQGQPALAQALGLRPAPWRRWLHRRGPSLALPVYLGALALLMAALMVGMLASPLAGSGLGAWPAWLAGLLMLGPASEVVVALANRLISESLQPAHLPRLALADGIPPAHRVLVVVPAFLSSAAGVAALLHRLRLHHLANPEAQAQFALLADWPDAPAAQLPGDAPLLADALLQLAALNALHPRTDAPPRFVLLLRPRRFSPTEQAWIGWERKRGKLEQLVHALASGDASAFADLGSASLLVAHTPYIVTLDADTQLPPGRLRELVAVAAHPHNQPVIDMVQRRVVGGAGILQPRLATPLPAAGQATRFHWLFAGQGGVDPYSAASSELYQDLFDEGSFSGKGLLHVAALQAVLAGRLPDGLVLSHDLLEGSLARCAVLTDITLVEEAPFHADVAASRVHRWMRGDWQLLPLLRPGRLPLAGVHRWKMLDNLRRSLVAPLSLGLLLVVLAGRSVAPLAALLLVLAAFAAGPLMGALAGLAPSRDDIAKRHFYRQAGAEVLRALLGGLWHLAMLLQQALAALDAIGRALWRLTVSHRGLLQWTTAAAAQAAAAPGLRRLVRQHRATSLAALGLAAALAADALWGSGAGRALLPLALAMCALWGAAPLWTWWVSRPLPDCDGAPLDTAQRHHLQGVARDTWRYFERCVTAADLYLPPDNLQTTPHDMLAHRTSPTNIGLYLLSAACARRFGWITTSDLADRLDDTLGTLDRLERHRGHLLNWYDTRTGAALLPRYVSTVDSGNFSGHLLAVAQACAELAAAPATTDAEATRLRALATRCTGVAWQADYAFLYHPRRHLLHIGYRVAEQQLDAGFYDLLASESRLTSLLAIAKGDVPVRHWSALGRPFFAQGAVAGLRSWSGSMFEYLMPSLVLDEPPGSVLRCAGLAAVQAQMAYVARQHLPWGISESAYAGCDHTLAYQYAPQGVPALALRRTPPDELVIAPYASVLAAQVVPGLASRNLVLLQALGARGSLGFIEALDYTPALQTTVGASIAVNTFMAHHQGMSLVALANVLLDGVARRWGMADPHLQAVGALLHERAPREVPMRQPLPAGPRTPPLLARTPALLRHVLPGQQAVEPTQLLGNGRFSLSLRANGAGTTRLGSLALVRERDDALRDEHGSFLYLRRQPGGPLVSITQHPAPDPAAHYRSVFHADRVCFDAEWPSLQAHVTCWVSPEDDIAFRQVELRNASDAAIEIELVSAFVPTLADPRADEAHPAFGALFMQAQWQPAQQAMVFQRRPRLAGEPQAHLAHFITDMVASNQVSLLGLQGQADRARWLGRNRANSQPLAALLPLPAQGAPLVLDTGLDPVCVLSLRLRIGPRAAARFSLATAASTDPHLLRALVDTYRQPSHVQRASLMSATLAGIRQRSQRLSADNLAAVQALTTALLQGLHRTRLPTDTATSPSDRRLLWRLGISGERPLLLVSAGALASMGLLRTLAQALPLWSWGGLAVDLVVVNAEPASYLMPLQREVGALHDRHLADGAGSSAGFHLLRADALSPAELSTLQALARVRLVADGRSLLHHVHDWLAGHDNARERRQAGSAVALQPVHGPGQASQGLFSSEDGAFSFNAGHAQRPTRPWINVLANPGFGSLVSESGGGNSWAHNSRLHQITPWQNDPVADPPGEWLLLQDSRTMQAWSATPSAWGAAGVDYRVVHAPGSTRISHQRGDLHCELQWCVDRHQPVRQLSVRLHNLGPRTLRLRLVAVAEWQMGERRSERHTLLTALHTQRLPHGRLTALLATQREAAGGLGQATAWLAVAGPDGAAAQDDDWTCDRRELFDARGQPVLPDHFGRQQGAGLDPCAALGQQVTLAPGQRLGKVFLLGHADSPEAARSQAALAASMPPAQREAEVQAHWSRLLDATTVATPDPLFDALVNRWLLYQAVSCRLWAKAGFYQAGGATGFRDQLQDTLALAWAEPHTLRAQILLCASRQFVAGDVQHWWHAPGGAGVRTHFSDDLLWLPHALLHYLRHTGDVAVLDEVVGFLDGAPLPVGAEDRYDTPAASAEQAPLYEHAARTLDRSLRTGVHGLPLMGAGDWNDGMNRVGIGGLGESVWLAWFLGPLVAGMVPLAQARGEADRARAWADAALGWRAALDGPAWDGDWYARAFFDDGSPLGSHTQAEARIDLIAQAWAVLSGTAPPARQQQAMAAVQTQLADGQLGLLRLLHPPLAQAVPSAGYIQAYPPGVRENGGQYNHAAVWALMAQATLETRGLAPASDQPYDWFTWISPAHRSAHPVHGPLYGLEPYAVAGDVYSQPPYGGRGGWSWYTGAAAWLHRAAVESIFGLDLQAGTLCLRPSLPAHWPQASITLQRDGHRMQFVLQRPGLGQPLPAGALPLAVGAPLDWTALPADSCFVLQLPAA